MRGKASGFDGRPLRGKKFVITRAAGQAPEFSRILSETGAEVLSLPTIQIVPPRTWGAVDKAIRDISRFDWILFTSANGVTRFFQRLRAKGCDIRDLKNLRIGAIGPKTTGRLEALGLKVDAFPEEYRAEALADVIGQVKGRRVLLARAEKARDVLPKTLEARGAAVTIAAVYRTLKPRRLATDIKKLLLDGEVDAVTFSSSSTVEGFMDHFSPQERRRIFRHTKAAAIGPITAATLRHYGVRPAILAKRYTIEALAKAIVQHFQKRVESKA
jgi:uroporphyrinogen III methyltransferase/synthase